MNFTTANIDINNNKDDQSLSSTEDHNQFGETLARAQHFFGNISKGIINGAGGVGLSGGVEHQKNVFFDLEATTTTKKQQKQQQLQQQQYENGTNLHDRYTQAARGNLYRCVRSIRHVDSLMDDGEASAVSFDDLESLGSRDSTSGVFSMSKVVASPNANDDDGGDDDDGDDDLSAVGESKMGGADRPDAGGNSVSKNVVIEFAAVKVGGDDAEEGGVREDEGGGRMPSYLPVRHHNRIPSRRMSDFSASSVSSSKVLASYSLQDSDSNNNERSASRRSSAGSEERNGRLPRRMSGSWKLPRKPSDGNLLGGLKGSLIKKKTSGENLLNDIMDGGNRQAMNNDNWGSFSLLDVSDTDARNRFHNATAMKTKTNVSITANDPASFKELQRRMKMKGAVTGTSVRALLHDNVEDHVAENDLDISETDWGRNDLGMNGGATIPSSQPALNRSVPSSANLVLQYFGGGAVGGGGGGGVSGETDVEEELPNQQELKSRLEKDPLFGGSPRPYVTIPSHEGHFQIIKDIVGCAVDQGEGCFLNITGDRYTGKSKLVRHVLDSLTANGTEFTELWSHRSGVDSLTSFCPFRDIVSTALRECDFQTRRGDSSSDNNDGHEDDGYEAIVHRLIRRRVIDKTDHLMLGRILPAVRNNQLLSLLKGRSPTAMIKDLAKSLVKIMIPLQPVLLIFEADGNDDDIDSGSFCLMEELLTVARGQCPQILLISLARKELEIPKGLSQMTVPIHLNRMQRDDMKTYIRSLFCDPGDIDKSMRVDTDVAECVYECTKGCPLFTDRVILWATRKELIELDESINRVVLAPSGTKDPRDRLSSMLPDKLNEDILELLNKLPHQEMDALKVACCLGTTFRIDKFEALRYEGFYESLLAMIASHGIFDKVDDGHYKWKNISVFEAVESIIISNERIEIHGRIADSLNPLTVDHIEGDAQFARHYSMADRWNEAFSQYLEAGKMAERNLDSMGATSLYKQAEACLKKMKQPTLEQMLSPHIALGMCLRELVQYDEAEKELEYCVKETDNIPEEDKKSMEFIEIYLKVITALATLKQAQSKYGEAMELYDRALPMARRNQESHSKVWLANHVAAYAEVLRKSGNLIKAKQLHTEALEYRTAAAEAGACTILELALSFTQLGCTLFGLGDFSQAYNLHKKALVARVEHLDFNHALVSESLNYCADALQAAGDGKQGIPLGMHAVKIRKHAFGTRHPAYAHALSVLGSCYHSIGRPYDALELLEECLDICELAFSTNHANLIPNLMLYGSVLRVTGDYHKARSVYERAMSIHKKNFGNRYDKQRKGMESVLLNELTMISSPNLKKAPLDIKIPHTQLESGKEHVIICADIGSRPSDEYMLAVASSMRQMGMLQLVGVVTVCPPQVERADMTRGAMDSLLLSDVPVAFSGVSPTEHSTGKIFKAEYGKPSPHVNNTGVELLTRAFASAPDKSLVLLCSACLCDVADVIDTNPALFSQKVKEVVVIGSVKPFKRSKVVEPEESGSASCYFFAKKVYKHCQMMKIPTITLCPEISRGFLFPSSYIDELAATNHMVGAKVRQSEEMHLNRQWDFVRLNKSADSEDMRDQKFTDSRTFSKLALGNQTSLGGQENIWSLVKSVDLELTLGLMCCLPHYRDAHFRWESNEVNGVHHKACRQTSAVAGMVKIESLANEMYMLMGYTLRSALLNTSC